MAPDSMNITPIGRRRNRAGAGWGRLRACQQGEIVFSFRQGLTTYEGKEDGKALSGRR